MNKIPLLSAGLFLLCYQGIAHGDTAAPYSQQAAVLAQDFMASLKPVLKKAMMEQGPVHAIDVCSTQAPAIAKSLSEQSGWEIKRVSLQARNPNAVPDTWEKQQLALFATLQKQGVEAKDLNASLQDDTQFRYMQAQVTDGLCLSCHGKTIGPDVKQALAKHYPSDQATGYVLGEVRGAISLRKIID